MGISVNLGDPPVNPAMPTLSSRTLGEQPGTLTQLPSRRRQATVSTTAAHFYCRTRSVHTSGPLRLKIFTCSGNVTASFRSGSCRTPTRRRRLQLPRAVHDGARSRGLRYQQILAPSDPAAQQVIGRAVSGLDKRVWDTSFLGVPHQADLCKFGQNLNLRSSLLGTGDNILAEASPYDAIWGIGFKTEDPRAYQLSLWPGLDLLGRMLMSIPRELSSPPPIPNFPSRPERCWLNSSLG